MGHALAGRAAGLRVNDKHLLQRAECNPNVELAPSYFSVSTHLKRIIPEFRKHVSKTEEKPPKTALFEKKSGDIYF